MKKLLLILSLVVTHTINAQVISTFAGNGTAGYTGDGGLATAAKLNGVHGVVMDASGNTYVADKFNNVIRKINAAGVISTIAGTGTSGHTGDGGPATAARLNNPFQIVIDAAGNLYFCEESNYIRKISATGIISSIAGNGTSGSTGDGGPATAASFNRPEGLALDALGNFYLSDFYNNTVRKINTSGIISSFAGSGSAGYSGDGGAATAARINKPNFLFIDHLGNLYISDNDNHAIRKVDASGIITTFAGAMGGGYSGDGGLATAAQLHFPCGIAEDAFYNIYIADEDNNRIRRVDPAGIITTAIGSTAGYGGDGGAVSGALLSQPVYTYFSPTGDLYISDLGNSAIRRVAFAPRYISDSFKIYISDFCSGPEIRIVPNHYTTPMYVKTYFGDGNSDSSSLLSGSPSVINHPYDNSGAYTVRHVLFASGSAIDSFHYTYYYTRCTSVRLSFYYEGNANCTKDDGEFLMTRPAKVAVDSNGVTIDTLSCTSGLYYIAYGSPGTIYRYRVIETHPGLSVSCPLSGIIIDTIVSSVYSKPSRYIGLSCNTGYAFNLGILTSARGTGVHAQDGDIYVHNSSCSPSNGIVTLNHSPKYLYISAIPLPASTTATSITWNFPHLTGIDSLLTHIYYHLEVSGPLLSPGDTTHSMFSINPIVGDMDTTNNVRVVIDTVRAGYDPNNILVLPAHNIGSGENLKYTINFENTGNDTAFNIYVMDTLSDDVDVMSYNIVASSHTMFVTKLKHNGHNILKFDFPQINLLDSSHHGLSKGMVMFSINSKTGLPDCHHIYNRAGIYFDINPVVMTNEVDNIIGCWPASVNEVNNNNPVYIYPNPTSTFLNINTAGGTFNSFSIANSVGSVLLDGPITKTNTEVGVQFLPSGVYFVTLKGANNVVVQKFVKW